MAKRTKFEVYKNLYENWIVGNEKLFVAPNMQLVTEVYEYETKAIANHILGRWNFIVDAEIEEFLLEESRNE